MSSCLAPAYVAMWVRYDCRQRATAISARSASTALSRASTTRLVASTRHVPLERAGKGLVEVAQIERQVPFRRRPQPEVEDVGVSAHLHHEPGVRTRREVCGHHRRRPSVERPRRCHHAPEANRYEVGEPDVVLGFEDPHGAPLSERRIDDAEPAPRCAAPCSRPAARRRLGDVTASVVGITRCAGRRSPGRSRAAGSRWCPRRSCRSWRRGASARPGSPGCSRSRRGSGWPRSVTHTATRPAFSFDIEPSAFLNAAVAWPATRPATRAGGRRRSRSPCRRA